MNQITKRKITQIMIPNRIINLQKFLNKQDNCGTQTPLFCVMDRIKEDTLEEGNGTIASMFLTLEGAEWYKKAVKHRLRNPYIWVRGPGEDSDIHILIEWFRSLDLEKGVE